MFNKKRVLCGVLGRSGGTWEDGSSGKKSEARESATKEPNPVKRLAIIYNNQVV